MSATTANEFEATAAAEASAKKVGMSAWGCFWRVGLAIALIALTIFAVAYATPIAIAAITGLELSAMLAAVLSWATIVSGYIVAGCAGWFGAGYVVSTLAAREAAKLAAAA